MYIYLSIKGTVSKMGNNSNPTKYEHYPSPQHPHQHKTPNHDLT